MNETPCAYIRFALIALILIGSVWVVSPFIPALLFAAVVCLSTWPLYSRLQTRLKGRHTLAAAIATALLALVVLMPMSYLAATLTDAVARLIEIVKPWFDSPNPSPPAWLASLPLIGQQLDAYWRELAANQDELAHLGRQLLEPARKLLTGAVALVGRGLIELVLVVFIAFFFYRDGTWLATKIGQLSEKIGGDTGTRMLNLAHGTVMGVMIGIVGTAATQGFLALVGFLIAGVPAPLLLAAAIFFLSMVPVGPPLIWGGAAWWLYSQGETGWAIFMLIWGMAVISSVDNLVRPLLISHHARLPILIVALGVFGGILAFGFVGIFLGPVILALALALIGGWIAHAPERGA